MRTAGARRPDNRYYVPDEAFREVRRALFAPRQLALLEGLRERSDDP